MYSRWHGGTTTFGPVGRISITVPLLLLQVFWWIVVGPADQPDISILLAPPGADPGITEDERQTIVEMMAKGTYGWILLATPDLDGVFERVQASAEVVQEPTEQPYGIRDCAVRDPAGNLIRIRQLR